MRNLVLDGIRGWAALAVVLFHFIEEPLKGMTSVVTDSWLFFLLDGTFYVCIFFVVSGQALSASFMRTGDIASVDALLLKRYARLTIPIVLSCMLVYILFSMNLTFHKQATEVLHNQMWMGRFMSHTNMDLLAVVKYSLIDVYTKHILATSPNPFLWTMSVEMVGSLLVFCVCYVWGRLKFPLATLIFATVFLLSLGTFYSLFLAGVAISAATLSHDRRACNINFDNSLFRLATLAIPIASLLLIHLLRDVIIPVAVYSALAILSVLSLQHHTAYRRFLTTPFSLFLGRISFPLYAIHFAVLISPAAYLWSQSALSSVLKSDVLGQLSIGLLGAIACIPVAYVFVRIEKFITPKIESAILTATHKSETGPAKND